jgi:hypothetical protein
MWYSRVEMVILYSLYQTGQNIKRWSDYRRVFDWWLDLLDTYTTRDYTSQITTSGLDQDRAVTFWEHCPPCVLSHRDRCRQERGLDEHQVFGGITYVDTIQCRGQDRTLCHPCLHFPWRRHFDFYRNSAFSLWKKWANELDRIEHTVSNSSSIVVSWYVD